MHYLQGPEGLSVHCLGRVHQRAGWSGDYSGQRKLQGHVHPCCTSQGQSVDRTTRGAKAESRAAGSLQVPSWGKSWGSAAGVRGRVPAFKVGTIQCFWAPSVPSLRELFASLSTHCVAPLCLMPYALQIPAATACCGHATASPVMGYSLTLPLLKLSYCGTT